jgi:hypothetical protein
LESVPGLDSEGVGCANGFHLEEFLDAGEKRLDAAKTPVRLRLLLETLDVCQFMNLDGRIRSSQIGEVLL